MKITIIGLDKWGYNKYIAQELSNRGIQTKHIDYHKLRYIYPSKLHKIFNFFAKTFFNYNLKRNHLSKQIEQLVFNEEKQDVILIIKGDDLSVASIKKIRKHTDSLIAFFNDSVDRYPRMKKIHPFFDKVYSFDQNDVKKYKFDFISNYIYFDTKTISPKECKYNVFNISSLDKRLSVFPQFVNYFKKHNIDYKLIAYTTKDTTKLSQICDIEFTQKTYSLETTFSEYVCKSKILLDLQRPKQLGLSFRILEGIGLEKKIITTNRDVIHYDFYNPNNIAVVNSSDIKVPDDFFNTPYQKIDLEIVKKYHISSWVDQVFGLTKITKQKSHKI